MERTGMSSDGIRKSTKGWEISPSGEMALGSNKIVVIDEPTVPAMAAMKEAAKAEAARVDAAKTEVSAPPADEPRSRRTTLETFNDELAVLERPIEGDVEYADEKRPRRWSHVAAFIVTVAIVGGGGAFAISRHRAAVAAQAQGQPAAPTPPSSRRRLWRLRPSPPPSSRPSRAPSARR
jgi:hypothetical protein